MVKPRENRVPIMLSDEELKAIDDWRFENRVATRSEAIRRLCQIGLLWDEQRMLVMSEYQDALEEGHSQLSTSVVSVTSKGGLSPREAELTAAFLRFFEKVARLFLRLRLTQGVAKNLKSGDSLEEEMTRARSLLADLKGRQADDLQE